MPISSIPDDDSPERASSPLGSATFLHRRPMSQFSSQNGTNGHDDQDPEQSMLASDQQFEPPMPASARHDGEASHQHHDEQANRGNGWFWSFKNSIMTAIAVPAGHVRVAIADWLALLSDVFRSLNFPGYYYLIIVACFLPWAYWYCVVYGPLGLVLGYMLSTYVSILMAHEFAKARREQERRER